MKKLTLLSILFSVQLALLGCTTQVVQPEKSQAQRLTIVSSGDPAKVLPAFKTYTWSTGHRNVLSNIATHDKGELKEYLSGEIKAYLSTKGYEYREDPQQADVVIGFLFALEDAIADKTIQDKFGLLPGLTHSNVNDPRYEKGSFLFAVFDHEEKLVYWRSAVQGFVDLEKDKDDESTRKFEAILDTMLGSFPYAGK